MLVSVQNYWELVVFWTFSQNESRNSELQSNSGISEASAAELGVSSSMVCNRAGQQNFSVPENLQMFIAR